MAPAPPPDEQRLEAYYQTETKYVPAPVPTPLDRDTAVAFVNAHASRSTSPEKMRKLMRLAVFYDLRETAPAFANALTGDEGAPRDFVRSAMCLVALAWVGDAGQQTAARRYFHHLQERADAETDRGVMLEVVEAFGPSEGTGAHRQWIQTAIAALESQLRQMQANRNVTGARLMQEKIKALTEYLNIQLPLVERALSLRQRIEAMSPPERQIQPTVVYALGAIAGSSPALSFWASMRLLRFDPSYHPAISAACAAAAQANSADALIRARALRAAEYFGATPPEPDYSWLATQPDTGIDPLVLRPQKYLE
jgi:hypothetical protein